MFLLKFVYRKDTNTDNMFNPLNQLILDCYDKGYSSAIYLGSHLIAFFLQLLFLILYRKRYGFTAKRAALVYLVTNSFVFLSIYVITWMELGFRGWGATHFIRIVMWMPLLLLPFAKLFKIEPGRFFDFFAPSYAISFPLGHIGCAFAGCCYGYPCDWGIYNPVLHKLLFPVQFVECLISLLIFFYLLYHARRHNYESKGKVLALFILLTGLGRVITEFLRDVERLFFNISDRCIWAFLAFVSGIVMLFVIRSREKNFESEQNEP